MPRRPSKKSKVNNNAKPRGVNRADAKITRWNDRSDIPLDEEDQFHASRDEILLDGDYEDNEDIEDEEVFGLKGMSDDEDEEMDEGEEEDGGDEFDVLDESSSTSRKKDKKKLPQKGKKSKGKGKESASEDSESEEESWGRSKAAYYSSNAAQLDSEDEEGNQLEEQEVKRLQSKARVDMVEDDFGLEDPVDVQQSIIMEDFLEEVLPITVSTPLPQVRGSLLRHLEKTDPESLALARDWTDTAENLVKTRQKLQSMQNDPDAMGLGLMHVHYQTLLTYATTLAFYLHLRAQTKYAIKPELLKSHPIIKRLLTLKQALIQLEDLNFATDLDDEDDFDDDEEDLNFDQEDIMIDAQRLWRSDDDSSDHDEGSEEEFSSNIAPKPAEAKAPALLAPPKKKRKTSDSDSSKSVVPIFDLEEPEYVPSSKSASRGISDTIDVFGEAMALQYADAADKSARKKTLRFHTSRIESTSARRQGARNNALGGDDDIPYRERKREKGERLAQEAKAQVKNQGGADLDDTEPEPRKPEEDVEDENGYYELVRKKSKEKREKKKAEYEATRAAERIIDEDESSGPRSLTRAILANKGLTPHRSKSVRNPRVKKRQRFEKAKKKVASQKAVYKGGLAETGGRYDGEKSGISKVVKSVRLSG